MDIQSYAADEMKNPDAPLGNLADVGSRHQVGITKLRPEFEQTLTANCQLHREIE
jgi:hypothetical protein